MEVQQYIEPDKSLLFISLVYNILSIKFEFKYVDVHMPSQYIIIHSTINIV